MCFTDYVSDSVALMMGPRKLPVCLDKSLRLLSKHPAQTERILLSSANQLTNQGERVTQAAEVAAVW